MSAGRARAGQAGPARLDFLEGYRAIAAIAVVIFHAYQNNRDPVTWRWPLQGTVWHNVLYAVDMAVDLFFVQSAFLLSRPYLESCLGRASYRSARGFLIRRIARVVPLYYMVVLLVWGITNPILPGDWHDLLLHLTFTQTLSQSKIFYTDGPAWSLAVEMQFYLLLPVLGVLAQRACRRLRWQAARVALLLCGIALIAGICNWYRWSAVYSWHTPTMYWPVWFGLPAKLDVFADGMLLALLSVVGIRLPNAFTRRFVGGTGLALLVAGSILRTRADWPDVFTHGIYGVGCMLLQGATILGGSRGPRWARSRMLVALGAMSYSLYLWHEPVLRALRANGLLPPPGSTSSFAVTAVALLAAALPVAWLSYSPVERTGQLIGVAFDAQGRRRQYYQPLKATPVTAVITTRVPPRQPTRRVAPPRHIQGWTQARTRSAPPRPRPLLHGFAHEAPKED